MTMAYSSLWLICALFFQMKNNECRNEVEGYKKVRSFEPIVHSYCQRSSSTDIALVFLKTDLQDFSDFYRLLLPTIVSAPAFL